MPLIMALILVGCAQIAAAGDPKEVVGSMFFLCSNVCQFADPRSTSNFEELLLDDQAPMASGKHARLSFSGWP